MFFVHELPEISDQVQLINQKNKDQLTPEDTNFLLLVDKYRAEFKQTLNQNNIKMLVQNRISLLQKQQTLEGYLKTNVDLMRLLLIKTKEHPKFSYRLTISKKQQQYKTEQINTVEEACGCEIVMARYMYLLGYNNSATPNVLRLRYSILQSNVEQGDIQESLKCLSTGWIPFQKLYNVMDDLLHFLVIKQQQLIPELKMASIFSFKLLIECNMNFLYLEQLRPLKEYETMVKVCKSSYTKLTDVYNRLAQISDDIKPEIIQFCVSAQTYFKTYGIWSILMKNETDIYYDRTQKKSYSVLAAECNKIANQILETIKELSQIKNINEYDQFTLSFIQNCITQTLSKSLTVYGSNQVCQSPDQLLVQYDSFDYCDVIKQQK